jgi:hypothetical protein
MAYDSAVPNAASSLSDTSEQPTNSSDGRPNSSTLSRISVTNDEQSALPTETHSEGLSSGAKIGLAAGIPCGILFLIAIGAGAYLFLKRSKTKAVNKTMRSQSLQAQAGRTLQARELDNIGTMRQEMETPANITELPDKFTRPGCTRHELGE